MVTLKDVAREAGVDLSTVSRSLNGSYGVNEGTRRRVLDVAARLQYRPNRVARGLATGRSNTLGLIISDIRNPFFAEVARGAEDAAFREGRELLLCNSDLNAEKQMRYVRSLVEKRVDGILMNSVLSLSRAQQAELTLLRVPIVLLNRPSNPQVFSTVCSDNFEGGRLAGEYLVSLGHRTPLHLSGSQRHGNLSDRARGFLQAAPDGIVTRGDHTSAGAYAMTLEMLNQRSDISAIFAGNDTMAFGAIRAIKERGLRIPDDISIVGFDNLEYAALMDPPLTTIHQQKRELGEAGVEMLLKMTGRERESPPEHRILGVELVQRQSCGACSAHRAL